MDLSMEKKQTEKNATENPSFPVINKHPAHSDERAAQVRREMCRELAEIFKRHAP